MADKGRGTGSMRGRFLLGESYGEPGPGLGTLYEAWRAGSSRPALVLFPGEQVDWRPAGPWRVILSCEDPRTSVSLEVEQAPADVSLPELANLLVLMSSTVERVEEHPRVQAHMASGLGPLPEARSPRAHRAGRALALAGGMAFVLGLGLGRMSSSPLPPVETHSSRMDSDATGLTDIPSAFDGGTPDAGVIAYPLPPKPFPNQALPPCKPRETELIGGCWQSIDQRPPCDQDLLDHQGKCYAFVVKRPRLPQAVEPTGK